MEGNGIPSKGRLGRYCEFSLYALVDFSCKRFSVEFPEGFFVFPFWSLAPQTRSIYMFWKCIRVGTVKGPKSWHSRHLPIVMHVPIGKTKWNISYFPRNLYQWLRWKTIAFDYTSENDTDLKESVNDEHMPKQVDVREYAICGSVGKYLKKETREVNTHYAKRYLAACSTWSSEKVAMV